MKFEDIRYEERNTLRGKQQGLVMPGGFWVQKRTMQGAWQALHKNWASIHWSQYQSAKDLVGAEFWTQQEYGGRLAMGRCVRHFIRHDMLPRPLEVANPGKKGKRLYRTKKR